MLLIFFLVIVVTTTVNTSTVPFNNLLSPEVQRPTDLEKSDTLRGLYTPDNIEKQFDDGSDKSPPAPVILTSSPYGPVPAGSGLEGQYAPDNLEKRYDPGLYVPDNLEKRFDDGLYKIENTPEPILVKSPFGLVNAGSGLEGQYVEDNAEERFDKGQYVADNLEKRFDDGLYRGEVTISKQDSEHLGDSLGPSYRDGFHQPPRGLVQAGVGLLPAKKN